MVMLEVFHLSARVRLILSMINHCSLLSVGFTSLCFIASEKTIVWQKNWPANYYRVENFVICIVWWETTQNKCKASAHFLRLNSGFYNYKEFTQYLCIELK